MTTSSDKTSPPASTTIGYGYLLAKSGVTHAIVMAEVFSGLLFSAVLTGLVLPLSQTPSLCAV